MTVLIWLGDYKTPEGSITNLLLQMEKLSKHYLDGAGTDGNLIIVSNLLPKL